MSSQPGTTYGTQFEFEETGQRFYAGTGDPNGTQVGTVGDFYFRADCSMTVPPLYAKLSGTASNTGWVPIATGYGSPVSAHIFTPQTGALTIEGQSGAGLGTGELHIVGNQPTVIVAHLIQPSTGALTIEGQKIPTLFPKTGELTIEGNQAIVVIG